MLGRLFGTLVLALIQSTFFLLVAFAFGARYPGGVAGVVATIGLAGITAVGMGGVSAAIAIRTGSLSLLQSLFPFMFVLLFTAPAFFPQELLAPVLRDVSVYNPLTYIVEGDARPARRRRLARRSVGGPRGRERSRAGRRPRSRPWR